MKLKVLFIFLIGFHCLFPSKKYVIGCMSGTGFFWNFMIALNHIMYAERIKKIPVIWWDSTSPYYQKGRYNDTKNVWEYYFEQVSNLSYDKRNDSIIKNIFEVPDGNNLVWLSKNLTDENRKRVHTVIKNYIQIKPHIIEKVENFYQKNMKGKKTVGIHLRGTDKYTEFKPVPFEKFLKEANNYTAHQFFIASDEERLLNLAKAYLPGKVIFCSSTRSYDTRPIHLQPSAQKAILGQEVLIDCLLLSRCDALIHSQSFVSTAALYFNPELKNVILEN